jgi:predicted secreted protein
MADYKRLFAGLLPLMIMVLITSAVEAGEICVCPDGCQYSSIQEAVGSAEVGEEVAVESGVYAEDLIIGKAVMLQGYGADADSTTPVLAGMVTMAADMGKISGFEFAGSDGGGIMDGKDRADGMDNSCILNIAGPINVYLNNIPGSGSICTGCYGLWNSSLSITYQFESRIFRGRMGNYWADYGGVDKNRDGIGDQPKIIDGENADYYPLMKPVESYRVSLDGAEGKEDGKLELIRARINDPFTIELNSNPTTGYKWFVDYDYHLLSLDEESYEKAIPERLGSGGRSVFTFKPLKPGKTAISLVSKRPWENIAADTRTYHIEIEQ